jgi:hypothetical protein
MLIRRVFDILGPKGYVPNGINWKNTNILWDYNFHITHDFINEFNSTYTQASVYDCNLNLPMEYLKDTHISWIHYDSRLNIIGNNPDENFYYTIHPYGNVNISTGLDTSYHQNVHCFDFISKKAIEYSNAKNFYFIYDYSSEGCIDTSLFESLHIACDRNGINPSKVIVITSAMNTYDIYKQFLLDNKTSTHLGYNIDNVTQEAPKNLLYTAFYPWSLLAKANDTNQILYQNSTVEFNGNANINSLTDIDKFDSLTNRSKKSLCLNRRLAPHRLIVISYLIEKGLFDQTHTSFDTKMVYTPDVTSAGWDLQHGGGFDNQPYLKEDTESEKKFKTNILKGYHHLIKKKKNVLDYDDIDGVWGFGFESSKLYEESYFSITTETLFYEAGNYISEKTWKPMAHLHPFVLIGRPGILKYLRKLGFKTFGKFWDESYDDEKVDSKRMIKCLEVIKTLINKSTEEWDLLNKELKEILIHNRNHLMSFRDSEENNVSHIYIKNLNKLLLDEPNQENFNLL